MENAPQRKVYSFDDFRIDASHRMLYHRNEEIPMVPKAVELLLVLIERQGKIVSKDELLEAVWPDTVVEESNLFLYLSLLRKTLGTQKDGSPYVETLRRRGYRFNGEVLLIEQEIEGKLDGIGVKNHERQTQPGRIYVVKDWERNKTSTTSSAVPALKPVEFSNDLTSPTNELIPGVSVGTHTQAETKGLVSNTGRTRYAKLKFVLAGSLVILLAGLFSGFYWRKRHVAPANVDKPKTIAILPFRSLVAADGNEVLELGMADTLITRLGSIRTLSVRPISSVRKFNSPSVDARQAGQELGVESVLDASVQRTGERIRVNVRLIRVEDGSTVWSKTFDEKYTGIFVVQDVIATEIASALNTQLTSDERTRLAKRYTSNPDAYEYYFLGRANHLKITKEGLSKAIEFYEAAIKADPNFALAYAHMADSYRALGLSGFANINEVWPKGFKLSQKALGIDSSLGEAHLQVAWYESGYLRNPTNAESKFRQVIEMNPNDFQAHLGYAFFLSNTKRHEEAIAEARRARELSPMTPLLFALESQILLSAGKQEEAIFQAKKGLEIDPNFWVAHLHLGKAYSRMNRYDDAIAEFEKARQLAPESHLPHTDLARLFVRRGDHKKAYAIARELESQRSERFVPLTSLAAIYSGLGDKDRALYLLEKASQEGERFYLSFSFDNSIFDNVRSDPRFVEVLRRMNIGHTSPNS